MPNKNESFLTDEQGEILVRLARQAIAERLGVRSTPNSVKVLQDELSDPVFDEEHGIFVCLKTGEHLRGCIGSLVGTMPIKEGVRDNALNAAFCDNRFMPLTIEEFGGISIEVSVLTPPVPLDYRDSDDLVKKLRPNIDGVIIRKGMACATFLPQVWEQLPRPADFLSHLCMKACLPADTWRHNELDVSIYQVQKFAEK